MDKVTFTIHGTAAAALGPIRPQERLIRHPEAGPLPIRADHPGGPAGARAYVNAWIIWKALNRDCVPTSEERAAAVAVAAEFLNVPVAASELITTLTARRIHQSTTPADRPGSRKRMRDILLLLHHVTVCTP